MDIKIEGINGLLPNLDLVTLANRMCMKEGLHITFKNRVNAYDGAKFRHWKHSLLTMISMVLTQSTGVPNGNHGLFHRFGIQAVTIHGFHKNSRRGNHIGFYSMGKILEGLYRSLNNLLERFHQSYFFYLLPSSDRFVSIIWYMPVLAGLVSTLLVKSLVLWSKVRKDPYAVAAKRAKLKKMGLKMKKQEESDVLKISTIIFLSHVIGIVIKNSPQFISQKAAEYGYTTDVSIFYGFGLISLCLLLFAYPLRLPNRASMITLLLIICWEIGICLTAIGMLNFSFGIIIGLFLAPILIFIHPSQKKSRVYVQRFLWLVVNPFVCLMIIVYFYTHFMFPNMTLEEEFGMTLKAARQALVFAVVDSLVYGNWIYDVVCCIFLPMWLSIWCLVMSAPYVKSHHTKDTGEVEIEEFQIALEKKKQ